MVVDGVTCRVRRLLCATGAGGVRSIEFVLQCVTDFLIEDACVLCGVCSSRGESLGADATDGEVFLSIAMVDCLTRPVEQRVLGLFAIRNQPLCPACAWGLPAARRRGLLGTVANGCVVVTAAGERFGGEAAPVQRKRLAKNDLYGISEIGVVAPFMENDATLRLIHLLKFSRYEGLATPMGLAMAIAARRFGPLDASKTVMVPVPMAQNDRRRRGFNQSLRLASVAGQALGVPVAECLVKSHRTRRQSQTSRQDRADNVRAAFHCWEGLCGETVILVDDLVTSGATAAACAAELLRCGAGAVDVLCFARAL